MSEKKGQIVPIRKPTRPSKPPTNKKPEVTQTCGGNNAMTMKEIKELPPPATPAVQVVEQTYQEGEDRSRTHPKHHPPFKWPLAWPSAYLMDVFQRPLELCSIL